MTGWVLDKSAAARTSDLFSDPLIAETALYHDLGVVHIDGHFARIAEVRLLVARRLGEASG